jgi:hypothetical protein
MKLTICTALALIIPSLALPIANTTEVISDSAISKVPVESAFQEIEDTSQGAAFQISENAIESVWMLAEDVSAITVDDQVLFINNTIAGIHMI